MRFEVVAAEAQKHDLLARGMKPTSGGDEDGRAAIVAVGLAGGVASLPPGRFDAEPEVDPTAGVCAAVFGGVAPLAAVAPLDGAAGAVDPSVLPAGAGDVAFCAGPAEDLAFAAASCVWPEISGEAVGWTAFAASASDGGGAETLGAGAGSASAAGFVSAAGAAAAVAAFTAWWQAGREFRDILLETLHRLGAAARHAPAVRHVVGAAVGFDGSNLFIARLCRNPSAAEQHQGQRDDGTRRPRCKNPHVNPPVLDLQFLLLSTSARSAIQGIMALSRLPTSSI
jgi:hypothetical protein